MLKKKRFSGLFGTSMTEIPSPGPEHQVAHSAQHATSPGSNTPTHGFFPQMLGNQGRQGSIAALSNSSGSNTGNFGHQNGTKPNGAGMNSNSYNDDDQAIGGALSRTEVHQSLDSLKKLVVAAESYRELTTKLAKTTKQLGKCFKEYGDSKGMDSTYVMCLKSCANYYESFSEMENKLATCLQKDFELLQNNWEKHTKRVSKDEKVHDEVLGDLDERIKKISMNYDKKSKKPDPNTVLMSHEKYISTLSELQDSIAATKKDHRSTVARRERYTHSLTAQIGCRLAEAQFLAIERQLRGSGPSLLKIKEWAPYAGYDMPPPTLNSNGDPTIEVRSGTFEEYTARHVPSQQQHSDSEVSKAGSGMTAASNSPGPVQTLTEMPQITLPPFAPMQQRLQQQQQQPPVSPNAPKLQGPGNSSSPTPSSQYQSPTPMTMPVPMPTPSSSSSSSSGTATPGNLPTTMPEPKNYIPQRQAIVPVPSQMSAPMPTQMPTPMPLRIENTVVPGPAIKVGSTDQKVLVKETGVPTKVIQAEPPVAIVTNTPVVLATKPTTTVLTTSPPTTPGAFPITVNTNLVKDKEGTAVSTRAPMGSRPPEGARAGAVIRTEHSEGNLPEDQGSVSTKVGSMDGGSTQGESMMISKMDYLHEMEHTQSLTTAEEAADAVALDRYHREKYLDRYGYPEDDAAHFTGDPRRDMDRDDRGPHIHDEMYDDPYSPTSGDQHSFYDEGDDGSRLEPRRFYDDDESQYSGSIPIQREREEYYSSRGRYEDREYDRSLQHYSSSMPTRHQQQRYLGEREQEHAEWTSAAAMDASDTTSMGDYAREQYPTPREYPSRPTLEDRERELEMMNQKPAVSSIHSTAASRAGFGRRPGTAPGTVAHLRRRFSDLSVPDMSAGVGSMTMPAQDSRPRGMSGSGPNLQLESPRRDSRYPPRASTPQSRQVSSQGYRYERGGVKGMTTGVGNGSVGASGRYSDYEDGSTSRMSALVGDQRTRRR
ncbi:hypothetical protein BG011_004343 [Mortierella polycephala]|uniref:BAR domain-containing protein n=1 Tax=Mortierella polycephala TaxID=41804 RepID=A0A9P6Q1T1_9FUNG|nr:hypothetical protein BG011_004343 [Mortierella polycephala]